MPLYWVVDFDIYITEGGRTYAVHVRKISADRQFETFEISTKANAVTVQSNRPLIRAKGLKYKYPTYTILTGAIRHKKTFNKITEAITDAMEGGIPEPPKPKPRPDIEARIYKLGYNAPRREKGESYEGYNQRCEDHKQAYIKRNWSLLERLD